MQMNAGVISPRAYVFVDERHFLEPVHRSALAPNNPDLIRKTVNITNVRIVNKTVINEGPRAENITPAGGRPIQPLPARDLRRKAEAGVLARPRTAAAPVVERQGSGQPRPIQADVPPATTRGAPVAQPIVAQPTVPQPVVPHPPAKALEAAQGSPGVRPPPVRLRPAPVEKGATRLLRRDFRNQPRPTPAPPASAPSRPPQPRPSPSQEQRRPGGS